MKDLFFVLLCSAVEEVEVPELEPHPLVGLPDELVGAVHVLGVGARVGGGHDLAHLLVAGVDDEAACLALDVVHVGHRGAEVEAVCKSKHWPLLPSS